MRRIILGIALAAGLSACAPQWLRQYTDTEVTVGDIRTAVSWIRIDDHSYDIHVSRAQAPVGIVEAPLLPPDAARTAALQVMVEDICRGAELHGDARLPVPRYTFRARCPR